MSDANIRITGIDATIKRLERVGGSFGNSLLKGAIYLRGVLATYPPAKRITRKSVYGSSFKTDRQRRWFFASLNDGSLTLPYRRSRNLGHRWTAKLQNDRNAIVGNNAPYARWVMDEDKPQSKFMAAVGWKTAQAQARREKEKVIKLVEADLKARLRRM